MLSAECRWKRSLSAQHSALPSGLQLGRMSDPIDRAVLLGVPLFPLPNVVLFPRAVLPLHVFEERYKAMTADALRGQRQVAMALLKPGWERNYHGRPAIEPIVCVGTILTHERLSDGRYNFLLQGHTRARVVREYGEASYRVAELEPLHETPSLEIDLSEERRRLTDLFEQSGLAALSLGRRFRELLSSSVATAHVADLIAFNFLDDIELKQELLADGDVRRRVNRVIGSLELVQSALQAAQGAMPAQ